MTTTPTREAAINPRGPENAFPETRVLIIGTGGTICMQQGPDGLQPTDNFLENAMAPRPSFNDFSNPGKLPTST